MSAETCPVCDARMRPFAPDISRCPGCQYFRSSFAAGGGTGIDGLEALRRTNFETLLDRLGRYLPLEGARLLEIGCAKGWFLEAAHRRGMVVTGIEPEEANCHIAIAKGFDVRPGYFPAAAAGTGPYDVIAFNDVFEHLPDPATAIKSVADLLAPGGHAVINIPSSDGALFRLARVARRMGLPAPWHRLWQVGLPSPHISYFNASNLAGLAERHAGLRTIHSSRLGAMTRQGLRARVSSASPGVAGDVMFAGAWALTFVSDLLPSDIVLVVLRKSDVNRQP